MRSFDVQRYRDDDFNGLAYRVVAQDEQEVRVMAESLCESDAVELADAMNSLERKFNG